MDYAYIKAVHIGSVITSLSLFTLRGVWMLRSPQRLSQAWVRVVPHAVDTLLLVSAIALVIQSRQYPIEQSWLTAKVVALLFYIGLGTVALKRGNTRRIRVLAWLAALAVFAYILAVAVTRNVWPLGS